jgi:hypothetical protein
MHLHLFCEIFSLKRFATMLPMLLFALFKYLMQKALQNFGSKHPKITLILPYLKFPENILKGRGFWEKSLVFFLLRQAGSCLAAPGSSPATSCFAWRRDEDGPSSLLSLPTSLPPGALSCPSLSLSSPRTKPYPHRRRRPPPCAAATAIPRTRRRHH